MQEKLTPTPPISAELDDVETLKSRYQSFHDATLLKWMDAIVGSHREAIAEVLKERGYSVSEHNAGQPRTSGRAKKD